MSPSGSVMRKDHSAVWMRLATLFGLPMFLPAKRPSASMRATCRPSIGVENQERLMVCFFLCTSLTTTVCWWGM